jgi:hypothetical protein
MPWLSWIDRTELPPVVISIITCLLFLPFYNFGAMAPQLPFQGAAFPVAFALALMFLIQLTRGASGDLRLLILADKIDTSYHQSIGASKRIALVELTVGLVLGLQRVQSQINFNYSGPFTMSEIMAPGAIIVFLAIIFYTIVEVHLVAFCLRQVLVFRRIAKNFQVDLMTTELNNALSNPLIRFLMVGLVVTSFGMLLYQIVPFPSLQRRMLQGGSIAALFLMAMIVVSLVPLFILKGRIAVAKQIEITQIRQVLKGDFSGVSQSHFGQRLAEFTPADLMYYEDRVKNIWEWPIEAHIRRLVIFGLLPPLTWVLAAAVEVIFESVLINS